MRHIGVDGCAGGWFAVVATEAQLRTERYGTFEALWADNRDAEQVLVDVPIGLLDDERRPCDVAAKERLGCRGNSVFYAPCRSVVELKRRELAGGEPVSHSTASAVQRDATGNGLSQQAWNITDKIAEVDGFLEERGTEVVRESHPELCFYGFADRPMAFSKRTRRGRAVRFEVLEDAFPGYDPRAAYERAVGDHLRSEVKRDDIVDALVLAAAARCDDTVSVPDVEDTRTTGDGGKEMVIHHSPSRWERADGA
jgi:predicted RNase H-like nuclease